MTTALQHHRARMRAWALLWRRFVQYATIADFCLSMAAMCRNLAQQSARVAARVEEDLASRAFVDETGTFHCPCGRKHSRGPVNGFDVYRCLGCGKGYRITGIVALR